MGAHIRISEGKGTLRWGRRCSGGRGQGRSGRGVGVVEAVGRGGAAGTEVRCGGGGGIVRGECGGTVAVVGDGRWRAVCSWEGI